LGGLRIESAIGETKTVDTSPLRNKAKEAVERRNYDYAIELFRQILKLTPDDADSRRELRAVEIRQSKERGLSFAGKSAAALHSVKAASLLAMKKYDAAIEAAEDALIRDPGHAGALMNLGRAAALTGYKQCAVITFEDMRSAGNLAPKQALAAERELARAYEAVERISDALNMWGQVQKRNPADAEAARKIRDLSASTITKVIETGSKGGTGKFAHTATDVSKIQKEQAKVSEIRTPEELEAVINYTMEDLRERPDDPRLHDKLGDLYRRGKRWDEAVVAYKNAQQKDSANPMYIFKQHDVEILRKRDDLRQVEAKAKTGDAGAKEEFRRGYVALQEYRMKSFVEREKQYSTDSQIRFELGQIYFEMAELKNESDLYDQAIRRFQTTFRDPKFRVESGLRMGVGFSRKGQYDLALKRFDETLAGLEMKDDKWKNLTYAKADTLERKGQKSEALVVFLQIYEQDVTFRDIGKRIEKLQKEGASAIND
jgi:tetratricopeptide (TPR) repeat protein